MKPSLIVQDFGGVNNADLHGTRARLMRGASWKKQRIVSVLPASENVSSKFTLSYRNVMFPPNQPAYHILAENFEVGDGYSQAIESVLANPELSQWEYILTIEHDNFAPCDGVLKLLERMEAHPELSCIGGLYYTKGEGGVAQIWGDPTDPQVNFRPQLPDVNGGLVECCGTGMGFNLFRLSMFKDERIKRPWFRTIAGKEGIGTQDLSFWGEARKYGYRCAIDCSVKVGHYDAATKMVW